MKGKIWILILVLLIGAIGTGIIAGTLISNAINEKAAQQEKEDRGGRSSRDEDEDEDEEEEEEEPVKDTKAAEQSSAAREESSVDTKWGAKEESSEEEPETPAGPSLEEENRKAHAAYVDILTYIHDHPTEFVQGFGEDPVADVEYNSFAVADITDDGIDELIVVFTNTYMAGMYSRVYTWDSVNGVAADYAGWIGAYCIFYHGEYLQEMASHNQGPSSLWPYSVSRYDRTTLSYQYLFSASSVDASLDGTGNYYHEEDDLDGDGVIYYIYPADFDYYQDPEPLTLEAFTSYVDSYIPETNRIDMEFVNITMENISALQ